MRGKEEEEKTNQPAWGEAGWKWWGAGVAKGDRKIRRLQTATLIRKIAHAWSMLFELNARQGVGLVAAEDEDLAVVEEFGSLTPTLP